jgi:hypothetical protein
MSYPPNSLTDPSLAVPFEGKGLDPNDRKVNVNARNGNIQCEHLTVNQTINCLGNIITAPYDAKVVRVPTDCITLSVALDTVFGDKLNRRFRILLENQGPHNMPPKMYSSKTMEFLSIEAETGTDHMGMYYGHNVSAYSKFGLKGQTNTAVSGSGPFSVVLSGGNTVVTVAGNEVDYPLGFGAGVVKAPGWVVGAPPGVVLGTSPNFSTLLPGDKIRWFAESTNAVTEHTIISTGTNSLTVNPAIPVAVTKGSGFSVVPRATILLSVAPFLPDLVLQGTLMLNGLLFESVIPAPFPALLNISEARTSLQRCLLHTQLMITIGGDIQTVVPNTFMDKTNGVSPAQLWVNSNGKVYGFRQHFIGPSAGFYGRAGGKNTMCFSLWVKNNTGVSLTDATECKLDGHEAYKCGVGVSIDGRSHVSQFLWLTQCGIGLRCTNNSTLSNGPVTDYGPLPVFPLVIDGSGAGTGIVLDYNSQLSTNRLRLRSVTTHATVSGVNVVVPPVTGVTTLISDAGTGAYGARMCGFTFSDSDVSP